MKKLIFIIIFIYSHSSLSNELVGEWIVDMDKTIGFAAKNIKLSVNRERVMVCHAKNTKLFFSEKKTALVINKHYCGGDKEINIVEGVFVEFNYESIFNDEGQTVLKLKSCCSVDKIKVLNWTGDGAFWVDDGDDEEVFRYFYKKLN